MKPNVKAALEYAARGWSIIPIGGQKKPLLSEELGGWKEFQSRRATEDEIKAWWQKWPNANVGVVTGAISNLIVLDCDAREGLEIIEMNGGVGSAPCVLCSFEGDFRKRHFYFDYPDFEARNFAKKLPGLDLRGEGGYVLAPPSKHPSGVFYEWEQT